MCIKYGDTVQLNEHVVMNDNTCAWADSLDYRNKHSMVLGYVNKFILKFRIL